MKPTTTISRSEECIDSIQRDIESTRDALSEKVDLLRGRLQHDAEKAKKTVTDAVDTVKNSLSIEHHVRTRPWASLGGAIVLGYTVGSVLRSTISSRGSSRRLAASPSPTGLFSASRANQHSVSAQNGSESAAAFHTPQANSRRSLAEQFGPELKLAKGLAIGAAAGVLRDLAASALPRTLSPHAVEIVNRFTQNIGGTPIGPVSLRKRSQSDLGNAGEKDRFSSPV